MRGIRKVSSDLGLLSLLILVSLFVLASCGGGGGDGTPAVGGGGGNPTPTPGFVTLIGKISGAAALRADIGKRDLSQATRVLVFNPSGSYFSADIVDGQFSIQVPTDEPVGMIFVGAADDFLGYLSLGEGIASIPIAGMDEDISTIDLGELTAEGIIITPSNNPLDDVLAMGDAEKRALALFNNTFASTILNPDVDGNDTIDMLEGKQFIYQFGYGITNGSFDNDLQGIPNVPAQIYVSSQSVHIPGTLETLPDFVYFTGPAGSGLDNTPSGETNWPTLAHVGYMPDSSEMPAIPPAGTYLIQYDDTTLVFNFDQSRAEDKLILAIPKIHLNEDDTIQKISWYFMSGDGSSTNIDPSALVPGIHIQVYSSTFVCPDSPANLGDEGHALIYEYQWAIYSTDREIIPDCQDIAWADVSGFVLTVKDFFDNNYMTGWELPVAE